MKRTHVLEPHLQFRTAGLVRRSSHWRGARLRGGGPRRWILCRCGGTPSRQGAALLKALAEGPPLAIFPPQDVTVLRNERTYPSHLPYSGCEGDVCIPPFREPPEVGSRLLFGHAARNTPRRRSKQVRGAPGGPAALRGHPADVRRQTVIRPRGELCVDLSQAPTDARLRVSEKPSRLEGATKRARRNAEQVGQHVSRPRYAHLFGCVAEEQFHLPKPATAHSKGLADELPDKADALGEGTARAPTAHPVPVRGVWAT